MHSISLHVGIGLTLWMQTKERFHNGLSLDGHPSKRAGTHYLEQNLEPSNLPAVETSLVSRARINGARND